MAFAMGGEGEMDLEGQAETVIGDSKSTAALMSDANKYEVPTHVTLFGIEMKRGTAYTVVDLMCTAIFIGAIVGVTQIKWTDYSWRFYVGTAAVMVGCIITAEVNRHQKFHDLTAWCHQWRYIIVICFFALALIDFIILGISDVPESCDYDDPKKDRKDCPTLNPDKNGVRYITRTLTIIAGILFIFSALGYWEKLAYFSAHSTWVQSLLYMTVFGYVFAYFARCLEPPPQTEQERELNWSWHQTHSPVKIGSNIIKIMIFVVSFLVVMGAIVLALFAESAKASGSLGSAPAILMFAVIAHIIMITPLAPGSVVDVCAGFLMVNLFVQEEKWDVPVAFVVALAITIVMHFSGSCAQYYVGKAAFVQIWANNALPPEMLAASDSVLRHANWMKVGIVGQVFMDTANGLNQGRMDMEFCTQFWSEYASIPSAISLVGLGATLAIPSLGKRADGYAWAEDAVPLMLMVASLWQMIASSWGAKELLSTAHLPSYWCALEKWCTVQYFLKDGWGATKTGWEHDVYELAQTRGPYPPLFNSVAGFQPVKKKTGTVINKDTVVGFCQHLCQTPEDPSKQRRKMRLAKLRAKRVKDTREEHWNHITEKMKELEDKGWVVPVDKKEGVKGLFDDAEWGTPMGYLQLFFVLFIYGSGVASYALIARDISLSDAVEKGSKVLNPISVGAWVFFALFWLAVIIYYYRELWSSLQEFGNVLHWMIVEHFAINPVWETVFSTPPYNPEETDGEMLESGGSGDVVEVGEVRVVEKLTSTSEADPEDA